MRWSGGAIVLVKLLVPGCPRIWMTVGREPIVLAVGAVGLFGHFYSCLFYLSSFSLSPETTQYRLKYCFKGPFKRKTTSKKNK